MTGEREPNPAKQRRGPLSVASGEPAWKAGGASQFWVFQGPSVKHLLTGYNAGNPNSFNGGVHSAGPNVPVNFGGDTYVGAQDQGNARYEYGRRYMIDDAFALSAPSGNGVAGTWGRQ